MATNVSCPQTPDLAYLEEIIRQESGRAVVSEYECVGDVFVDNRKGLAAAIMRIEIASGQELVGWPATKRHIDWLSKQTIWHLLWIIRDFHERPFAEA